MRVKSEILAVKNAIPTAKNRIIPHTYLSIRVECLIYIGMQFFLAVI